MAKPRKNKSIHVRLTAEEHQELGVIARKLRTDKSGAVREILRMGSHLIAKAIEDGKMVLSSQQPQETRQP